MIVCEITSDFQQLWHNKPGALTLLAVGFVVFLFVVIDTWRHKRRRRRRHHGRPNWRP